MWIRASLEDDIISVLRRSKIFQNDQSPYPQWPWVPSIRLKPRQINDTKSESFGRNILHWRQLLCNPHWVNIIFTDKSSSFTWAELSFALTFVLVVPCLSRFCPCPQNWYFCPILASVVSFLPLPPFPPCFIINFCPCPRDWYFCPIFSGVVFALAPISSMFCHQCLPLPLPSQLPFCVMAI